MARPRTTADERVLALVESLTIEYGRSPSVRELAEAAGYRSPGAVHRYLARLRDQGRLVWDDGRHRTLKVVDQ